MWNVLILLTCVLTGCIAFFAFFAFLGAMYSEHAPAGQKKMKKIAIASGAISIVGGATAYGCYQHLALEAPTILQVFWLWYVTGFVARLFLLYWKESILSKRFRTEWEEVLITFFTALIGPIQIIFTVRGILTHKPWP